MGSKEVKLNCASVYGIYNVFAMYLLFKAPDRHRRFLTDLVYFN